MKHFFTLLILLLSLSAFGQRRIDTRLFINGQLRGGFVVCEGGTVTLTDSSRVIGPGSIVSRSLPFGDVQPGDRCYEIVARSAQSITVRFKCRTIPECWDYPNCSDASHGLSYGGKDDLGFGYGVIISHAYTVLPPLIVTRNAQVFSENIDLQVKGGVGPFSFIWNDGATTEDRVGLSRGTYCVTVTDRSGCAAVDTCFHILGYGRDEEAIFFPPGNPWVMNPNVCQGDSVVFEHYPYNIQETDIVARRWEFEVDSSGNNLVITGNQKRVTITYNVPGKYMGTLTITTRNGNNYTFTMMGGQSAQLVYVSLRERLTVSNVISECLNGENRLRVEMPPPPLNRGYYYRWSNGYSVYSPDGRTNNAPVASGNVPPGTYCVTISQSGNSCSNVDTCITIQDRCNQLRNCSTPIIQLPHITTPVSGLVQWQPMRDVLRYQISWRPFGSNTWQNINIINPNASSFLIQNLNRNTTYQFRIRAWCINAIGYTNHALGTFTTGN